jgi:hypothetical protein
MKIRQVTETFEKKAGTKTVWELTGRADDPITEEQYYRAVGSSMTFRRMGWSGYAERGETCSGYRFIRLVSTSPMKDRRVVRSFSFSEEV